MLRKLQDLSNRGLMYILTGTEKLRGIMHYHGEIIIASFFVETELRSFSFNSPGTIVHLLDNFPFWAKILTDFSSTCYHFSKLISNSNSGQLVLVLWNVIRIWISVIT